MFGGSRQRALPSTPPGASAGEGEPVGFRTSVVEAPKPSTLKLLLIA